jgi:prefoldin subunit 5
MTDENVVENAEENAEETEVHFFKLDGGKKTKEIERERAKILKQMSAQLKSINFTPEEINQVLEVINVAQDEIQHIKEEMEYTNIIESSADEAMYLTEKKLTEIRARNEKMGLDIRAEITRILQSKQG